MKPQLSKQNTTSCLRSAKLDLDDPDGYWKNLIHSETELDIFFKMRNVWRTIIIKINTVSPKYDGID